MGWLSRYCAEDTHFASFVQLLFTCAGFDPGIFWRHSFCNPKLYLIYHFSGGSIEKTTLGISSKMDPFSNRKLSRYDKKS